jgi:hypothetical protein
MTTLTKRTESKPARPLGVLIPLIRRDIKDAEAAAARCALPYQISAGEKLIEAKSQLERGEWGRWLKQNFTFSDRTAGEWMRMARAQNGSMDRFSSVHDFRMKTTPGFAERYEAAKRRYRVGSAADSEFTEEMKQRMERIRVEKLNTPISDDEREDKLEKKLALDLIDIGYRALALKLHPDKGGSADAMSRLNTVRDNLKSCVNDW